jgi:methionine biosynthesis protein MetW
MNDNRNYKYSIDSVSKRGEFKIVSRFVSKRAKVIDLACGDGTLLKLLKEKKNVKGLGVELAPSGVKAAKRKGVMSIQSRIDVKLPFKDNEFDYAICNVTLHMVMYPETLVSEMVRISKKQIITFPNFAHFLNRLELLFFGRMPQLMLYGYKWFSTGEIHQLSIKDFEQFCLKNNIKILKTEHYGPGRLLSIPIYPLVKLFPNVFASMAVFLTEAKKIK